MLISLLVFLILILNLEMMILILRLAMQNSKPKFMFWANLSQKCRILHFAWKLLHRVSCKDIEEGLVAKMKMNNCIKCLLLLYIYRS